jgi:hypothetical protein
MIDIDEYIEMWNDHLLGSEGMQDLMNALIAEVERLREQLAKANKYVHTICQHSDSMLMDYEDYMKGDD